MIPLDAWHEVGERVFVRRQEMANLNVGLVVGGDACLVIDTRITHGQGRRLADAVREVTALPWVIVNTHGHYDHCFGNRVFLPADIWGHERCVDMLTAHGEVKRSYVQLYAAKQDEADLVAELDEVEITPPNRTFATDATLDLGGRPAHLRYLGLGHTDNDIVVEVPDAAVLFAGDLVEEGAPPMFGDSFPLDWPSTLDKVGELSKGAVVPGHGNVVDRAFVREQGEMLAGLAATARRAFEAGGDVEAAVSGHDLPAETVRSAVQRAFRQLRGDPPYESPDELARRLGVATN
jgi:glyoxylase-like metal-dependent hydrolase (beta-lactamase superfamily II)